MILNVNLAILNMLPIPVLDGGHIVLAIIESIRRKPVNMRVLEVVQTSCAVVIIVYMLYITFFDVQDLPFVRKGLDQLRSTLGRERSANAVAGMRCTGACEALKSYRDDEPRSSTWRLSFY